MALSDKWTLSQLRAAARRELMDTSTRWWTDAELNTYIDHWQNDLQNEFEFVRGVYSTSGAISTHTFSSAVERPTQVFWNGKLIFPTTQPALTQLDRDWRDASERLPLSWWESSEGTMALWPTGTYTGTLRVFYTKQLSFATDTSTMQIPAWTRYSVRDYVAYRAHQRYGQNTDMRRALRRKSRWERQLRRFRTIYSKYLVERLSSFRVGDAFEREAGDPRKAERRNYE